MRRRHVVVILGTALSAVGIVFWALREKPRLGDAAPSLPARATPSTATKPAPADVTRSTLADGLNDPRGTIQRDVGIVAELFTHWSTNFPRAGNPVGTNAEITAALIGRNALGLALVPPDHPALNLRRELVDRWGTPFRFHQWSGAVMEVISAGPDRAFATEDDVSSIGEDEAHPAAIVR